MSDDKQQSPKAENAEQGFNDSELADIMSEIENLEKEFSGEEDHSNAEKQESAPEKEEEKTDLQKTIDQEVEQLSQEDAEPADEKPAAQEDLSSEFEELVDQKMEEHPQEQDDVFSEEDFVEPEAEVTQLREVKEKPAVSSQSGNIQLKASGNMDLELEFSVGEDKAQLKLMKDGFCVELNGIQVSVDQDKGCQVHMPGGAEFSIPVHPKQTKKAS